MRSKQFCGDPGGRRLPKRVAEAQQEQGRVFCCDRDGSVMACVAVHLFDGIGAGYRFVCVGYDNHGPKPNIMDSKTVSRRYPATRPLSTALAR